MECRELRVLVHAPLHVGTQLRHVEAAGAFQELVEPRRVEAGELLDRRRDPCEEGLPLEDRAVALFDELDGVRVQGVERVRLEVGRVNVDLPGETEAVEEPRELRLVLGHRVRVVGDRGQVIPVVLERLREEHRATHRDEVRLDVHGKCRCLEDTEGVEGRRVVHRDAPEVEVLRIHRVEHEAHVGDGADDREVEHHELVVLGEALPADRVDGGLVGPGVEALVRPLDEVGARSRREECSPCLVEFAVDDDDDVVEVRLHAVEQGADVVVDDPLLVEEEEDTEPFWRPEVAQLHLRPPRIRRGTARMRLGMLRAIDGRRRTRLRARCTVVGRTLRW